LSFGLSACPTIKNAYIISTTGGNPDYNCGRLVANAINIAAKEYPNIPVIIINRTSAALHGANDNSDFQSIQPTRFVDKVFTERSEEYKANIVGHMVNTICEFSKHNPVYITRPTPELKANVPLTLFRSSFGIGNPLLQKLHEMNIINAMRSHLKCKMKLLNDVALRY
jgi:hypothetical protein